ncbi:MAG TPA: hypothetical protein PLQ91_01430 [Bacteroidales bacterium]|nr:hypothetical protein [Bacteroidales bacterium]HXK90692.1 hypothetical protein [Bacteroidales bacterium]
MKKLTIISIIILFHITTLTSNNIFPDSLVIKWAKDDPTLSMILSSIPKNWHFELKDSFLKIFCEDSLICEPKAMKSDSIENVYIDKVQPFILLRYEPIWSIEKLVNSRQKNEILYKQIIELQQKYNKKPTKNQNILDKNSTHLDSVYYNKLQVLNDKYIAIPDFSTSKYSWFFVDECCVNNEDLKFSPIKISLEMINIKNLFRELGGK